MIYRWSMSVKSSLGSEWPYWKGSKQTWLVKETNIFSRAQVETSPVKIYSERATGLNLAHIPGPVATVCHLLELAWQTPTKRHASPSASSGEITCWKMTDTLVLETGSTEFNPVSLAERSFYSSAHICMCRAITGDCNECTQLQNLICRRMLGNSFHPDSKTH